MGSTCVSSLTIFCSLYLSECSKSKIRVFGLLQRGTGNESVANWQHRNGCHFVPYLMYITGAKFEQQTPIQYFRRYSTAIYTNSYHRIRDYYYSTIQKGVILL